jgi:hypothetical protein
MSVRKLALAIASRVNGLRERLIAQPQAKLRALAMVGASACLSGGALPDVTWGQEFNSPIQDPFAFDPDFNWFEPIYQADFEDMKPKKRANRGWFASYDRMNLYGSRPEQGPGSTKLDSGWGNRYDVGFMLEEDNGWQMTYMDVNGPNEYDSFERLRLNQRNLTQQVTLPITTTGAGTPIYAIFPQEAINNPGFNTRFVNVADSLNVVDFNSLELNKTWRLEPYHYGGMLEPLVGFRYMSYDDTFQDMSYRTGLVSDPAFVGLAPLNYGEQVDTLRSVAQNDMFGGQVGFRYFKFADRFRYSAELRVFTMANFQCNEQDRQIDTTVYSATVPAAPLAAGALPLAYYREKTRTVYARNEEFVFGFDVRSEVSYQITKMIEVRGGFQLIDLAQGLWRGNLSDPNARTDQQALMVGGTFGIALNR